MMINKRSAILWILMLIYMQASWAQQTAYFDHIHKHLESAKFYFQENLFGQTLEELEKFRKAHRTSLHGHSEIDYSLEAELLKLRVQLKLDKAQAESDLKNFIATHYPNPLLTEAIYELGDYYYNAKDYGQCIEYFDKIDIDVLPEEQMSELVFKKGYCHFVRKEFDRAQREFSYSRDIQNRFFYPINYYDGMCYYFDRKYDRAIESFRRVENSSVYKPSIPYYICQIHFATREFDQLLSYGEKSIQKKSTKKIKEIRLLLGQAYFQRNDYTKALPHLEYYEDNTGQLTVEEFYQLAFTQYQLGQCDKAIDNFLEINREESKTGQVVNYYLADCYERSNDKNSARAAFKMVSQMNYDLSMKEEATYNYGKLSAELGFDREAINILMNVDNNSTYYDESRVIINDILINTGDYANAISILESLPRLNKDLEATYQKATFKLAIQQFNENNFEGAKINFNKSYTYPYDQSLIASANFWDATMLSNESKYEQSIEAFDKYFVNAKNVSLPTESSIPVAHYMQAYNLLKTEQYIDASTEFKKAIVGINSDYSQYNTTSIAQRMLPDAYLRAGDCLFKERRFDDAVTYYDQTIARDNPGKVYALFQRGLIEGLVGEPFDKILTMEELTEKYPESEYGDDAFFQLGDTYLAMGDLVPASNAFKNILVEYGTKSVLYNAANLKLGLINYNGGDAEGALTYYKRIFNNNPNPQESQEAMIAIEEIYIDDLGKTDEYFSFLKSVPGYEVSAFERDSLNYRIGEIQFLEGNYEKAVEGFDAYLKVYNRGYYRLEAHYYRGECLSLSKKYSKALRDYEAIISEGISDFYERSLKKAALISYNNNQNFAKALKYYKLWEETVIDPTEKYQAQLGALRSSFREGSDSNTLKYANLVINSGQANKDERASARYYLGKVSYKQKKLDQAYTAFGGVADKGKNNQAAESRFLMAKIKFEEGNLDMAENLANAANEKNKSYPFWIAKSIILLSDIYSKRNDLLNARAALEAVVENFADDEKLIEEANLKLEELSAKESASNRIKSENPDGTLELDTTGNDK